MFGVFKVNGIFRSTPVESNGCKLANAVVKPVIWDWDKVLFTSAILSTLDRPTELFVSVLIGCSNAVFESTSDFV